MSQTSEQVDLFAVNEVCTHQLPNKLQIIGKDHAWKFNKEHVWKVKLMDKFQAEAKFCKNGTECEDKTIAGQWSTIYD